MAMLDNINDAFRNALNIGNKVKPEYVPTPTVKLRSIVKDQPRFSGMLPYEAYDPGTKVFYNEDSIGIVMECRPITGANESIARTLSGIYVNCPSYAGVQFILVGSPNLEADYKAYGNLRVIDSDQLENIISEGRQKRNENIYRVMARKRIDYLKKGMRKSIFPNSSYLMRHFRLIVSVTIPRSNDQDQVETLVALRDTIAQSLDAALMPPINWRAEDLIKYVQEVLNPHRDYTDIMPEYDSGKLLKQQMVYPDTVIRPEPKGIKIGNADQTLEMRFMSVNNYPRDMAIWDMGNIIGDPIQNALQYPCPFILSMSVHILEYESAKAKATMKSARATTNSESVMAKFMPDMKDRKADWDIVMQSLNEGQRLVSLTHQLMLITTPKFADMAEQQAKAIFRTKSFDLTNDVYMQPQAIFSVLPMTMSKEMHSDVKLVGRVSTKTGDNAAHMTPAIGEWAGTKTPTFLLFGRRGQCMYLDLFDNDKGNFNAAVAGASGTGKSVFLNDLSMAHRAAGATVRIIDVGHSYEKTCKMIGGQYIEFKPDEKIIINPFPLIKDINEEMELLKPLLLQMAHPKEKPTDFEAKMMEKAIQHTWDQYGHDTTVTRIAETLMQVPLTGEARDQRIHDLGSMLHNFTKDGVYGEYFEGQPNVDFRSDYVVLELEDLNKKKELQTVVLLIMIFFIQQDLFLSNRSKKKIIMIDEAWDLIGSGGTTSEFIEKAYRRARKHGGSIICASQSVNDFYIDGKSPILDNADWLFLLRQKPEALDQLAKSGRISMSDGLRRLLATVKTEGGKYSEVFIHSPVGTGIGRLLLDPFSLLMYSTKAEDYEAYRQKADQGYSTVDALNEILKERGIQT